MTTRIERDSPADSKDSFDQETQGHQDASADGRVVADPSMPTTYSRRMLRWRNGVCGQLHYSAVGVTLQENGKISTHIELN